MLKPVLKTSDVVLRTYSGEIIKVMGKVDVDVEYNNQLRTLSLLVVEGDGSNLLGHNWLRHIKLNWGPYITVKLVMIVLFENLQMFSKMGSR